MLGAAVDEGLPVLVHLGDRAVRLEVEVLLPRELELAAEHMGGGGEPGFDVTALHVRLPALEAPCLDGFPHGDESPEWLVLDLDRLGSEPGGFQAFAQDPADGVPVEHDLGREQGLVVLDPRVVDSRDVLGGERPHNTRYVERRAGVEPGDHCVGMWCLDRPGMQDVAQAPDQVVGVERLAGDVQVGTLVLNREPHNGIRRTVGQGAHAPTSIRWSAWGFSANSFRRDCRSIAER
jgi:hypothetical protein